MYQIMEYDQLLNCDHVLASGETLQDAFKEFESRPHHIQGTVWIRRR